MPKKAAAVPDIPPLTVHTLGYFGVWRGETRLEEKAWGREKARQLFQYLITHRRRFIVKERIVDDLWPELDAGRADRDFKVALNALNEALQPDRPARSLSVYMARQGTSYGLNLEAPIRVDMDVFEEGLTAGSQLAGQDRPGAIASYRQALEQYQGDYLPDVSTARLMSTCDRTPCARHTRERLPFPRQ
jgi:two-component SAPR family response regulator